MGFHLDADVAQLASSSSSFADHTANFHSVLSSAEATAAQAQAVHIGDGSIAYQQALAQFHEAGSTMKDLLNVAHQDLGSAGQTYTAADSQHATDLLHALGGMPTSFPHISSA